MVYGIDKSYPIERKDILIFIIGLFSNVTVRVLGTFGISEILCFVSYFVIVNPFLWKKHEGVTKFFLFALLWLVGVFLSDRYNGTNLINSLKGAFNVIFLIGLMPFVYWALYDRVSRILYFLIGAGISSVLNFYFQKSVGLDEVGFDVWRVYGWASLFSALSGVLYYKGKTLLSCIVLEAFAIWSLFHLTRNIFITSTLSVCVILFLNSVNNNDIGIQDKIRLIKRKFLPLLIVLGIACLGIDFTYEYLSGNGILGERAYEKYYMQKNSKLGLASGRSDFLQSLNVVKDQPLFGYGSYAMDEDGIQEEFSKRFNLENHKHKHEKSRLPGHSYLLGGWVYAGILGFIFWLYVLKLIFKFLRNGLFYETKLVGINVILTFSMLWNIFFSPFGGRLKFLFYIIMVILMINTVNRRDGVTD